MARDRYRLNTEWTRNRGCYIITGSSLLRMDSGYTFMLGGSGSMKRFLIVLGALFIISGNLYSQNLRPIGNDLSSFMEELGKEVIPYLQQNALWGDGLGLAQISDESRAYFYMGAGATFGDGLMQFIDEENSSFELLNVFDLTQTAVENGGIQKIYDQITTMMPYPALRLAGGFVPAWDLEISLILSVFPQFITDAITGVIGDQFEGLSLNRLNIGLRVRKSLLRDMGWFPAISIGAGYSYSNFNASYPLPKDEFQQNIDGSPLTVQGELGFRTSLHSFGMDLQLSKKVLFFVPYIKFSSWYQSANYAAEASNFEATLDKSDPLPDIIFTEQTDDLPGADLTLKELSFLLGAGFELKFGKFAILAAGSYSLGSGSLGVNVGTRIAFGKGTAINQ